MSNYTPTEEHFRKAWAFYLEGDLTTRRADRDQEADRFIAHLQAKVLRDAASNPSLLMSEGSGISITKLRGLADEVEKGGDAR